MKIKKETITEFELYSLFNLEKNRAYQYNPPISSIINQINKTFDFIEDDSIHLRYLSNSGILLIETDDGSEIDRISINFV